MGAPPTLPRPHRAPRIEALPRPRRAPRREALADRLGLVVALSLCVAAAPGCYTLKPGSDVAELGAQSDDGGARDGGEDASCWDPAGFGGRGCWRCPATNREQLLNRCSDTTQCVPFDVPLPIDGGLPQPPARDLSPPPDLAPPADLAGGAPDLAGGGPLLPDCASLPNPIFVTGSTAVQPFLGAIAQAFENASPPRTVVYQSSGSCVGVSAIVSPLASPMLGTATWWDKNLGVDPNSAQARLGCRLPPGGTVADVGLSDVFATTCLDLPGGLDERTIQDTFGPVEVMNFVVPQNSMQRAISAEAAYLVFGFGGSAYPVPPWTDPAYLFQRNPSSGTQAEIARTIGLPRELWQGRTNAGSSNVRDALIAAGSAGQATANKALGILSSDVADGVRATIRGLAYQDRGQRCAFWPDSRVDATDKRGVREGHYAIFGPLHMLTHLANGVPTSEGAQALVNAIAGVTQVAGVNIIDLYARSGLIPQCAMRVTRDADGGDVRPFAPSVSCSCYYEERATSLVPPPGCTPCTGPQDCPSGVPCNVFTGQARGYCEP